jgi:hypothetical protein
MTKPEQFQYQFQCDELTIAFDISDDEDGGPFYDVFVFLDDGENITYELTITELAKFEAKAIEYIKEVYEADKLFVLHGV